ncbi:hypothetical protein [Desulfurispira natronophila]|uniref:Uncharacterized protein n=1 Tax=Desulfurispira natronophila TaxID=682562 RepID=A0A7W8DGG7_9BACT|nr:hypothetical protein [Desulfurispira natronophila]MBB5021344.1 hypothetical protein [Desulfurispira natronophila]
MRIDEYDGYYDLDYVIQAWIEVKSATYGELEFATPSKKGGAPDCVLLWDTGEEGKWVGMKVNK